MMRLWALFTAALAAALPSLHECVATKNSNPCALLAAGCMCNVAFEQFVDGMLHARCQWSRPYDCPSAPHAEAVLLRDRIRVLRRWMQLWESFGAAGGPCYDHEACKARAARIVAENASLAMPHNLGTFRGPDQWCLLVGLTTNHVSSTALTALFLSHFTDKDVAATGNNVTIALRATMIRAFSTAPKVAAVALHARFLPRSTSLDVLSLGQDGDEWLLAGGLVKAAQHNATAPWLFALLEELCGAGTQDAAPPSAALLRRALLAQIDPATYCALPPPQDDDAALIEDLGAKMDAKIAAEGAPESWAPARARVCAGER